VLADVGACGRCSLKRAQRKWDITELASSLKMFSKVEGLHILDYLSLVEWSWYAACECPRGRSRWRLRQPENIPIPTPRYAKHVEMVEKSGKYPGLAVCSASGNDIFWGIAWNPAQAMF
jgi:hypothetical protein